MQNTNNRTNENNGSTPEQERGKNLRHLMEDSQERGEEFRKENQGSDTVTSVLPDDSPRNQQADNEKPGR